MLNQSQIKAYVHWQGSDKERLYNGYTVTWGRNAVKKYLLCDEKKAMFLLLFKSTTDEEEGSMVLPANADIGGETDEYFSLQDMSVGLCHEW